MLNKAPALCPPTSVGIIAPASAPRDPEALHAGLTNLKAAGFNPVQLRTEYAECGYLAGPDTDRIQELNSFLTNDQVDALICVRGGYGALRLLDQVDFDAARKYPKLLVGYSDITALQLALFKHAGWVGISGPMVAVEWPDPDGANCKQFLDLAAGKLVNQPIDDNNLLSTLCPGTAKGTLLGGNLSLITRLLGTPHMPDLKGAILFLEEIGESPYRVDGLFAHLNLAGVLADLAGVVLGGFTESDVTPGKPTLTMQSVFSHYLSPLNIPVAQGLRYGHFPKKAAIPIGIQAELHCDHETGRLMLLESPVR